MPAKQELKIEWNRPATYEDANLLLRLYEERREDKLRKARAWFVAECKAKTMEDWKRICGPGSEENAYYRMVTTYWEMASSFVANGILSPELFFQNALEHLLVWERIKHLVPEFRKANNAPQQLKNLETVAGWAAEWLNKQGEGVYSSFAARFNP